MEGPWQPWEGTWEGGASRLNLLQLYGVRPNGTCAILGRHLKPTGMLLESHLAQAYITFLSAH